MMRKLAILGVMGLAVLGLSACNENAGWNPNYTMKATPYGDYQRAREVALTTNTREPQVIPIQLPARAPTPEEISGQRPAKTVAVVAVAPARATSGNAAEIKVSPAARAATGAYAGSTPVLVQFALSEKHNPGMARYARTNVNPAAAAQLCAGYASPAIAQTAFLAAGGPILDPRGIDPDGDGFVCGWDPRPYRQSQL